MACELLGFFFKIQKLEIWKRRNLLKLKIPFNSKITRFSGHPNGGEILSESGDSVCVCVFVCNDVTRMSR